MQRRQILRLRVGLRAACAAALLFAFTRVEVSERQADQQDTSDYVARGAVEQVVPCIPEGQAASAEHGDRERAHVGD